MSIGRDYPTHSKASPHCPYRTFRYPGSSHGGRYQRVPSGESPLPVGRRVWGHPEGGRQTPRCPSRPVFEFNKSSSHSRRVRRLSPREKRHSASFWGESAPEGAEIVFGSHRTRKESQIRSDRRGQSQAALRSPLEILQGQLFIPRGQVTETRGY